MTKSETRSHDVIIVGAGVAGSLMAWRLAKAGLDVLVLEAGPDRRGDREMLVEQYATASAKIPSAPYIDPHADEYAPSPLVTDGAEEGHYIQEGDAKFKSTYQRLVGGSTWHWLGNTPRFLPADFELRSLYGVGVDWPLSYWDLEDHYRQAEQELGVAGSSDEWADVSPRTSSFPMPPIWSAYGDSVVERRLHGQRFQANGVSATVRVRTTPQARNSIPYQGRPPCAGNSSCVPLCPIGAKYDASVHISRASDPEEVERPIELRDRSVVQGFATDGTGQIVGVDYYRWSFEGERHRERAHARAYVLAAHAIESPVLLMRSGLCRQGPVGKYLMDHLQGYGGAVLREPLFPFRGPPVTSGIDEFRDGAFRRDKAAFRVSIGNDGWGRMEPIEETIRKKVFDDGLLGDDLRTAVRDRITRMVRFSYSTEMLPEETNHVELGPQDAQGNVRPKIRFHVPAYNRASFQVATELFGQFFQRLGATETEFSYPNKLFSGAGHIMGTARMGRTERDSVVDSHCRAHEHPNLHVVGASAFPTCGTANPTLTVAALALRAADDLVHEWRRGAAALGPQQGG